MTAEDAHHVRVVRGVQRWAMILTAAGLLPDEDAQADYARRPWMVRGFKPVHQLWVKTGKPRPPGETGHDPDAWAAFVAEARSLTGRTP